MSVCKRKELGFIQRICAEYSKPPESIGFQGVFVAEKEGFEPSKPVKVYMISNHAPSTN